MSIRVGIYGGSFSPLHNGHLAAARAMRDQFDLDQLVFVPSGQPPLLGKADLLPGRDRLELIQRSIADEPRLSVTALELDRPGLSYTLDTVRALAAGFPQDARLYFLLGSDCLARLPKWRGIDELHAKLTFVLVQRAGFEAELQDPRLLALSMESVPVSSTLVRERAVQGHDVGDLVPAAVADYIRQKIQNRREEAPAP